MTKRTVLITGGSSGIGAAMVREFAASGYRVWFTYHKGREAAERLLEELGGAEARAFHLVLGQPDSHNEFGSALPGPVDVLVNNAGLGTKTVESVNTEVVQQDATLMMVNAIGALWLTREVLPSMEARQFGKILFVSSVNGGVRVFPEYHLADGMSKAALAHLGRQLQALYNQTPIDVFTICPGATDTPMFEASTLAGLDASSRAQFIDSLPGRRLIDPAEIARLAVWLCSDEARVLRGAVLDASLGLGVDTRPLRLEGT